MDRWTKKINDFLKKLKPVEDLLKKRAFNIIADIDRIKIALEKDASKYNASTEAITYAKSLVKDSEQILQALNPAYYDAKKTRFLAEYQKCYDTVKGFKLNAYCIACSGRAEYTLGITREISVSRESCAKVVQECAGSWNFMYSTN
jgi:hypothetical protein